MRNLFFLIILFVDMAAAYKYAFENIGPIYIDSDYLHMTVGCDYEFMSTDAINFKKFRKNVKKRLKAGKTSNFVDVIEDVVKTTKLPNTLQTTLVPNVTLSQQKATVHYEEDTLILLSKIGRHYNEEIEYEIGEVKSFYNDAGIRDKRFIGCLIASIAGN